MIKVHTRQNSGSHLGDSSMRKFRSPLSLIVTRKLYLSILICIIFYAIVSTSMAYTISGYKWNDANFNKSKDLTEGYLQNWEINLQLPSGTILTATTDINGHYEFTGLANGNYILYETQQDKGGTPWTQSYPLYGWNKSDMDEAPYGGYFITIKDSDIQNKNFGNGQQPIFPFCGDWTCGAQDIKFIQSFIAHEDRSDIVTCDGSISPWLFAYARVSNNRYQVYTIFDLYIDGVFQGFYKICLGDIRVADGANQYFKLMQLPTISCGQKIELRNLMLTWANNDGGCSPNPCTRTPCCGNCQGGCSHESSKCWTRTNIEVQSHAPGTISGMKWDDCDADGNKDTGELGLGGWVITLTNLSNNQQITRTTQPDGTYSITGVIPGNYRISETPKSGWGQTYPPSPGTYSLTVVADAPGYGDRDFGNVKLLCINGTKYNVTGTTPEPISGWKIYLNNSTTGAPITSTTTDGSGKYSFCSLKPGKYYVAEENKSGYINISYRNFTVDLICNTDQVKDFRNMKAAPPSCGIIGPDLLCSNETNIRFNATPQTLCESCPNPAGCSYLYTWYWNLKSAPPTVIQGPGLQNWTVIPALNWGVWWINLTVMKEYCGGTKLYTNCNKPVLIVRKPVATITATVT